LPEKKAEIDTFSASLDDDTKRIPFEHTTSIEATLGAIDKSIRTVLIVSDRAGYELVKDLTSGIAFNSSISSIIILNADDKVDE
jgi:hypothetical protein